MRLPNFGQRPREREAPSGVLPTAPPGFEMGRAAAREGRYQVARQAFEAAADQGVAEAYFELGLLYAFGRGMPRSMEKAVTLFALGAEAGSANAQHAYAMAHLPQDRVTAEKWLLLASGAGHAPAMARLAELISDRDPVAARALLARAAQAGHVEAMSAYGHSLASGTGGDIDPVEGLAWLYASAALAGVEQTARDVLKLARVLRADAIDNAQRRGRALAKQFRTRG